MGVFPRIFGNTQVEWHGPLVKKQVLLGPPVHLSWMAKQIFEATAKIMWCFKRYAMLGTLMICWRKNVDKCQGCRFVPYTDGTKLDLNIGETRVWLWFRAKSTTLVFFFDAFGIRVSWLSYSYYTQRQGVQTVSTNLKPEDQTGDLMFLTECDVCGKKSWKPSMKLTYCWWNRSCTSWGRLVIYPSIYRVLYIPGSSPRDFFHQQ